ncbi:GNAT family N-acetyltransferase [Flavobacterium frigoris]|uniref:Ribosomal protein S18 acetylase RimI n=1 Tax=Flavobacterium frigoris TaxID=229204 RepID=A0A1H9K0R1_FLAFI|nr:GNAT family N-acetyltransferase [Flavobacterium frigoris]SEQ92588.1 Ribosomal protein S18 acetylase RimI [Flavobacterium frigoris]
MITILRTNPDNIDFIQLIALLDKDIQIRDGEEHIFYAQFNKTDSIKHVVVAYDGNIAVGCGAFKVYQGETAEIKRMFVNPENRGKNIASKILGALEFWAKELSFTSCILETGRRYPEAIALYKKNGYSVTTNYGQYEGIDDSVCFSKSLS